MRVMVKVPWMEECFREKSGSTGHSHCEDCCFGKSRQFDFWLGPEEPGFSLKVGQSHWSWSQLLGSPMLATEMQSMQGCSPVPLPHTEQGEQLGRLILATSRACHVLTPVTSSSG